MAAACAGIPPRAASFCRGCLSSYRLRRLSVEPIFALGDQQVHLLAWSVVMNPSQIRLVQESFAKVAPISDQAAVMFYNRLFEIAPQVKAMFPADLTEQRKKLMATLAAVVAGLGNLETVLPAASPSVDRKSVV